MPFSRHQTRLATFSTFEPVMPASTNALAVPPTGPACAFADIVAKANTAAEPANQDVRAMMISLLWDVVGLGRSTLRALQLGPSSVWASIQHYPEKRTTRVPNCRGCPGSCEGSHGGRHAADARSARHRERCFTNA